MIRCEPPSADYGGFARARGHLPIPLRDYRRETIQVTDTGHFYDGRRTCGDCHDLARIENGFLFQQGRTDTSGNIAMRDDCLGDGRSWVRSTGMYGAWRPRVNRWMAAKQFVSESEIDQSAFWWTGNCSGCHPGGGGMEFDQDGQRFYDWNTGQFGYEALGKTADDVRFDVDYATINSNTGADFGPARWDLTDVAAPDCLMCHRLDRTWSNGWDMQKGGVKSSSLLKFFFAGIDAPQPEESLVYALFAGVILSVSFKRLYIGRRRPVEVEVAEYLKEIGAV